MTCGHRLQNPEGAECCRMPTKCQQQGMTAAQHATMAEDHLHSMLQDPLVVREYAMRDDVLGATGTQ